MHIIKTEKIKGKLYAEIAKRGGETVFVEIKDGEFKNPELNKAFKRPLREIAEKAKSKSKAKAKAKASV